MATPKVIVTASVPRSFADEVRRIAERESETRSAILRRLLRRGLETEQRQPSNEAA